MTPIRLQVYGALMDRPEGGVRELARDVGVSARVCRRVLEGLVESGQAVRVGERDAWCAVVDGEAVTPEDVVRGALDELGWCDITDLSAYLCVPRQRLRSWLGRLEERDEARRVRVGRVDMWGLAHWPTPPPHPRLDETRLPATAREIADHVGVAPRAVQGWARAGKLVVVGERRTSPHGPPAALLDLPRDGSASR